MNAVDVIRGAVAEVTLAGESAPIKDGALDITARRIIGITEAEFALLIDDSWRYLMNSYPEATRILDTDFSDPGGIYGATGYVASIDLLKFDDRSVSLFSASGSIESENPVQLGVEMYAENSFCIAGLAFVKALRGFAYKNRPMDMQNLNPVEWAAQYGRRPFTSGWDWDISGGNTLIGASGFTPSNRLIKGLSQFYLTSKSLHGDTKMPHEFIGSGLCDQAFVDRLQTIDHVVDLADLMTVQGANLNL